MDRKNKENVGKRTNPVMQNYLKLLSDEALGEGDNTRIDGLGFETYAKVVADAAIGTRGPFTIGVFGEWGTGKTSLMRLIQSNLEQNQNVLTVWFNAWRYEKEEHPIVPLVGTIIRELEVHKPFVERLKANGFTLIKALRAVAYGFSAKSKVKIPGFAEIEASFVAKDMIDREDKLTPDPLLDRSLYYQAFETLAAVKFPTDVRIVVLIDDLDRCFPDLAIRLLESIKLVLSQHGFIFVLGVARQVIEGYLQHRYKKEYGIAHFEGHSYLDKIVQLPFHIPPNVGRMKDFTEATLRRVEPNVRAKLSEILPIIGQALGGNPRSIIRFVNNILIDLAINADLFRRGSMEEIPLEYFAISRCLQQRWPDAFSLLTESDELAAAVAKWDRDLLRHEATSKDPEVSALATSLISSRGLQDLFQTAHGKSWLKDSSARDATVRFLRTQRREVGPLERESERRTDIFLSYSHTDREEVLKLAEILVDEDVSIFMDTKLHPGDDWTRELERGLAEARAIGICISSATRASEWIQREIGAALARQTLRSDYLVIPIMLPGADWNHMPEPLHNYQALDLREGITKSRVQPLLNALKK